MDVRNYLHRDGSVIMHISVEDLQDPQALYQAVGGCPYHVAACTIAAPFANIWYEVDFMIAAACDGCVTLEGYPNSHTRITYVRTHAFPLPPLCGFRFCVISQLGFKTAVGMPFKDIATSDSVYLEQLPAADDKNARTALRRMQEVKFIGTKRNWIFLVRVRVALTPIPK